MGPNHGCYRRPPAPNRQRLLVLKKYNETSLYTRISDQIIPRHYEHDPLTEDVIEDSTGAGDVFAGVFLTANLLGLDHGDCADKASRLVSAKLRKSGSLAYSQFGELLTHKPQAEAMLKRECPGVFISHGIESDALTKVERFIQALGLTPIIVARGPSKGLAVDDLVRSRMAESVCAVILATADEEVKGRRQPRGNVLHEIGLAQEVLKDKIIYSKEEGCVFPSNV